METTNRLTIVLEWGGLVFRVLTSVMRGLGKFLKSFFEIDPVYRLR